jgi:alpha-L-glutamate ligase-like protein
MSRWFISPRKLRALGVMGINRRNARYVAEHNPRRFYPRVDNKLLTKQLAIAAGIAVPELYGVVSTNHDARRVGSLLERHNDFVVKPAHGSGGEGIVVVAGRMGGSYRRVSGIPITGEDLVHHVTNILSGMYSLGGQPDHAMFEYRVRFDPLFRDVTYQGVPDIRIIVYRGFPVMAMVRLPTRMSDGKANLHQGAIGVGVGIADGVTGHGVWRDDFLDAHPDTGHAVTGLGIPRWTQLLRLAAGCQEIAGLGYLGVDLVLDEHLGPLVLELNARPGLSIQLANRIGLRHRLQAIDREAPPGAGVDQRVAFVQERFAH